MSRGQSQLVVYWMRDYFFSRRSLSFSIRASVTHLTKVIGKWCKNYLNELLVVWDMRWGYEVDSAIMGIWSKFYITFCIPALQSFRVLSIICHSNRIYPAILLFHKSCYFWMVELLLIPVNSIGKTHCDTSFSIKHILCWVMLHMILRQ